MNEGSFVLIGTVIGFVLSLCAFFIQYKYSRGLKKKKVKESLKFEMDAIFEIMTKCRTPFMPPDSVLQNIIQSGDLIYFDKELHQFVLTYYKELLNLKIIEVQISKDTYEKKQHPEFNTAFKNLRDTLKKETDEKQKER